MASVNREEEEEDLKEEKTLWLIVRLTDTILPRYLITNRGEFSWGMTHVRRLRSDLSSIHTLYSAVPHRKSEKMTEICITLSLVRESPATPAPVVTIFRGSGATLFGFKVLNGN